MPSPISPDNAPFDGRWWSPDEQSHVVGGRLELESDVWHVTLFGWLGPWTGRSADDVEVPSVIHGQIGITLVSLLDLVPGGWSASANDPPYETRISANTVIVGVHATPATRFTQAGVRLVHLNEWAKRRPWSFGSATGGTYTQTVTFTEPAEETATLTGATARLWRSWGQEGGDLSAVTMTSDEWVYFDFEAPIDLDTVEHDWVRPLQNFIELAAAARSPVVELTVTPEGADEGTRSASVVSAASRSAPRRTKQPFQFIFTLDDVVFGDIVPEWWKLHGDVGVVADLVASLRRKGGYVSSQFLTGASAIEGYHRHRFGPTKRSQEQKDRIKRIVASASDEDQHWLKQQLAFSHEPSFSNRLDDVVALAGPLFPTAVGDLNAWRKWVKDGRNSVAHRDPSMVDLDNEWHTTVRVTATIEWLMTLVLLREVGVPDTVIETGVRRNRGLQAATHHLREARPDWFV
ncbi:MAG: HEPN domain-containing protein [Acidimicrobiales bacterium]